MDLNVELRFMDGTQMFSNNTKACAEGHCGGATQWVTAVHSCATCLPPASRPQIYGTRHPGVTLHASSAGKKLMTLGRGDDTASWAVTDLRLKTYVSSFP